VRFEYDRTLASEKNGGAIEERARALARRDARADGERRPRPHPRSVPGFVDGHFAGSEIELRADRAGPDRRLRAFRDPKDDGQRHGNDRCERQKAAQGTRPSVVPSERT
jgi:hypothetical protein